jgi:outer membrane protein TolC
MKQLIKTRTLIVFLACTAGWASAQENGLTLDSCITLAKAHYPLAKQDELIRQVEQNNISSVNTNWLPKLSFLSQATYQSEVTAFNVPGFDLTFPKDQYMNALQLEQTLFDAGQIKQQKKVEQLNAETELEKNEVELYKLGDRVTQLYTAVLLARANLQTLGIYKDDISNKKKIVSESLKNGIVLQSNLDALEAEELKTEQNLAEARNNLNALYASFKLLIGLELSDSSVLTTRPVSGAYPGNELKRPELKLFSTQKNLLDSRYKLGTRAAMPRLTVFGEGVYGRPGYNFLDQNMRFFGKAGISLKWNISILYNLSDQKQNLNISKQMIDVQQEIFELNLRAALESKLAAINSLKEMIEKDKLIIQKRHSIVTTASTQLENGSITSTDYLVELNKEMEAVLNQKIHEIKLMSAISDYNTTTGTTNSK